MVYSKARLKDALRVFRKRLNCRDRRALPSEKLACRLRSARASAKVTPLDGVNWQAKSKASGSDDDEYHPGTERRPLAVRRNKKKRKSDDLAGSDQIAERDTKKLKGDDSTSSLRHDSIFCTIKLTSEKGVQFLRGIDALGRVPRIGQGSSRVSALSKPVPISTNSYFDKYLSSDVTQDHEITGLVEDGLLEMDVNVKDEFVSNKHKVLRSGKVVEKPAGKRKKSAKHKLHTSPPASDDERAHDVFVTRLSNEKVSFSDRSRLDAFEGARPVTKSSGHESGRVSGSFAQKGSAGNPISLDSDTEEVPISHCVRSSKKSIERKQVSAYPNIKQENVLPLSPVSLPRSPAPYIPPTILTISTAFAHPLNLLPHTTPPATASLKCHFCIDSRMAIIGLGRARVEVFTDPDDPLLYQEMGEGFRSRGFENTTICFSCVEERIRMMRCHLKGEQSYDIGRDQDENYGFQALKVKARINGVNSNLLYRQWLFPTAAEKRAGMAQMEASLLTCSLCPMPASWVCCRDRKGKADKSTLAVKIEDSVSDRAGKSRVNNAGNAPDKGSVSRKTNRLPGKAVVPADVIVIDSDSDEEPFDIVLKEVPQQRRSHHNFRAAAETARPSPQIFDIQKASSDMFQANRGCGLKLCENCKHHVVRVCHGVLDKKVIMAQFLRASQQGASVVTGRADVEFLFKGSVIDRFYEQEMMKRGE